MNDDRRRAQKTNAARRRRKHQKLLALTKICGKTPHCQCKGCGEYRPEFLSLDHINGGGNAHRKSIGGDISAAIYCWAIKTPLNEVRSILRVLCMNCNTSYGVYGYCPHQKEKRRVAS